MKVRARSGAAVLSALIAGAGGALASCGWIVGVGDYAVGDAAGDGTIGGPDVGGGGDVGAEATGSGDETPETAADATMDVIVGDVVVDSVSERSSDAGTDRDAAMEVGGGDADGAVGEAEAGIVCGQGIPSGAPFTSLVRTCVYVTSCDPYSLPLHLSDCITNDALEAAGDAGLLSCLSTITDCNGYYNCQGIRLANQSSTRECLGSSNFSSCVGNVAYDCSGAFNSSPVPFPGTVTNCSLISPSSSCQTYTDNFGNSRADCVVASTCTVSNGSTQCFGNNVGVCVSLDGGATGVAYGHSCGNAMCITTRTGGVTCSFQGLGLCSSSSGEVCSGDTLRRACMSPTQPFNYDCARAGGTCSTDNSGTTGCVSPGCTLSSTCTEDCDGSVMTACVGGAPHAINCLDYGYGSTAPFSTCASFDAGFTWCQP